MTDKLYEIAFSGQILEGADLATVKQHIAKIFKADDAKLAQMFSGKRMLIKRQADEITAIKYRGAFKKAGAICEITPLDQVQARSGSPAPSKPETQEVDKPAPAVIQSQDADYVSKYPESNAIPQALLTDPLGIKGDSIQELAVDVAPAGSQMQDHSHDTPEPDFDLSGFDVAPVGSKLSTANGEAPPPPPDTAGLSMED